MLHRETMYQGILQNTNTATGYRRLPLRLDVPVLVAAVVAAAPAVTAELVVELAACCGWPPIRNESGESFISSCILAISSGSTFILGATKMMKRPKTAEASLVLFRTASVGLPPCLPSV